MKKTKKSQVRILLIAGSLVVLTGFVSCSKDDGLGPVGCNNWSEKYLSHAQAYSDASAAYSNDPSVTNCNKLKTEGLNYVKSLEGILSCVPTVNKSEFNNDIKDLKAEINDTACDQ
ncbi:hypothetical protein DHD05_05695 [Arenibacter sp. N53]|uniref:hypothetical protein n=1 Tax=Arenibacter TaxID=178469 RepID=UPI000CD3AD03|nr:MULTISPECIES: hypothetical protein [Arenibacter]MCM4151079.1 hypothetical protein [Arenibacter sp. N53]